MISDEIRMTIKRLQELPNGLNRNKAVSHAQDALAHVLVLEMEKYPSRNYDGLSEPVNGSTTQIQGCACPMQGVIDKLCPVHGATR